MENAQLVTLSRQIALQNQMDVVANNMANITTTGFKASDMLFEDFLMPVAATTISPAPTATSITRRTGRPFMT